MKEDDLLKTIAALKHNNETLRTNTEDRLNHVDSKVKSLIDHINKTTAKEKSALHSLAVATELNSGMLLVIMEYLCRDDKTAKDFAEYLSSIKTTDEKDQSIKRKAAETILASGLQNLVSMKSPVSNRPKFRLIEGGVSKQIHTPVPGRETELE